MKATRKPGRPKAPPLLPIDLNYEAWEEFKEYREAAQRVASDPGMQAILAVLVNERPSVKGCNDAQFILGYEHAISLLRELLKGRVRDRGEELGEPDYQSPETQKELLWQRT